VVRLKGSHGRGSPVNRCLDGPKYAVPVRRSLVISPCQNQCEWDVSDETPDDERLFACSTCGSEWVASEPWTPVDADGTVPAAVQEERRARGRG
jgi:hypothetical protein